jgi:hypothetical protein
MKTPKANWRWLFGLLILLNPVAVRGQPCDGGRPHDVCEGFATQAKRAPIGADAKISTLLRDVLSGMSQRTPGTAGQPFTSRHDASLARINPAGEIHVYVELVEFPPEYVAQLEAHGLTVEVVLPPFQLIQGWLPAGAVDARPISTS